MPPQATLGPNQVFAILRRPRPESRFASIDELRGVRTLEDVLKSAELTSQRNGEQTQVVIVTTIATLRPAAPIVEMAS